MLHHHPTVSQVGQPSKSVSPPRNESTLNSSLWIPLGLSKHLRQHSCSSDKQAESSRDVSGGGRHQMSREIHLPVPWACQIPGCKVHFGAFLFLCSSNERLPGTRRSATAQEGLTTCLFSTLTQLQDVCLGFRQIWLHKKIFKYTVNVSMTMLRF